jgi:hypothetical protein
MNSFVDPLRESIYLQLCKFAEKWKSEDFTKSDCFILAYEMDLSKR